MPDCRRFRHPGCAEGALRVAVYIAEGRGSGIGGEDCGRFVPDALEMRAVAGAGFVAAGDEDHVFVRGMEGGWVRGEEGFVVGHGEGSYVSGGDFGGGGVDGVFRCCFCFSGGGRGGGGDGIGDILFDVIEPVGSLFSEGFLSWLLGLSGSCEDWQGEEEGLREMHG